MLDETKVIELLNDGHLNGYKENQYRFANYIKKAKEKPPMKRLFGELFQTGELCLLAGKTGAGKSILAYQIADGISRGTEILGLPNDNQAMKVLYYDFELNEGHIQKRFANYTPSGNFFRPDVKQVLIDNDYQFDFDIIEKDIDETGSKVVIIDNITALTMRSTQDQDMTMNLMKKALMLKQTKDVTILLVAHTIKKREHTPLDLYDIAGAAHLHNFIDNSIMIGKSKIAGQHYIKQVKNRNAADTGEVLTLQINTENWLHYDFIGSDDEKHHLPSIAESKGQDKEARLKVIADEILTEPLTYTDFIAKFADEYGKTKEAGKKTLQQLRANNIVIKNDEDKYIINQNEAG